MEPPRLLFAALASVVLAPSVLGQCEIAQPGSELAAGSVTTAAFDGDRIYLGGNGNQVWIYEPDPSGWHVTETLTVPGFLLFENPELHAAPERLERGDR